MFFFENLRLTTDMYLRYLKALYVPGTLKHGTPWGTVKGRGRVAVVRGGAGGGVTASAWLHCSHLVPRRVAFYRGLVTSGGSAARQRDPFHLRLPFLLSPSLPLLLSLSLPPSLPAPPLLLPATLPHCIHLSSSFQMVSFVARVWRCLRLAMLASGF